MRGGVRGGPQAPVSRRQFLTVLLIGIPAVSAAGMWFFRVRRPDPAGMIATVIRKKLPFLELDPRGLAAFSQDVQTRMSRRTRGRLVWLSLIAPLYRRADLARTTRWFRWLREVENRLVSRYLLSTDFFHYGADEDRVVEYLGYYDPYTRLCANPFARFD